MIKTESQRLLDAISVRKQLQSIGCTLLDENRKKLSRVTNTFVKEGGHHHLRLPISEEARALVHFYDTVSQQSGVVLEYI